MCFGPSLRLTHRRRVSFGPLRTSTMSFLQLQESMGWSTHDVWHFLTFIRNNPGTVFTYVHLLACHGQKDIWVEMLQESMRPWPSPMFLSLQALWLDIDTGDIEHFECHVPRDAEAVSTRRWQRSCPACFLDTLVGFLSPSPAMKKHKQTGCSYML